eukprot:m.17804 g.17804  ORF g.17804 m.17804 type:complete len:396 (-) comp11691_c0_seq1:301-1488(-)
MKRFRKKEGGDKCYVLEDFGRQGLQWPGKYFGRVPMPERNGHAATQSAIKLARENVKSGTYNSRAKKVKVFIKISVDGIVAVDLKNGTELARNAVHRITAWYPDDTAKDTFGVVVKGEGGLAGELDQYSCIVMKSPKARATLNALKQLLEIVFEPTFEETSSDTPQKESSLEAISAADINAEGTWECKDCTFVNFPDKQACVLCHADRKMEQNATKPQYLDVTGTSHNDNGQAVDDDGGDDDNANDDGPIEAYEATHDEEIEPDYQNLFESHGMSYEDDGCNYMNLPDGYEGDSADYMNLPENGDGNGMSDYMNLPDIALAERTLSPDSPNVEAIRPRTYSDNNPFAKAVAKRTSDPTTYNHNQPSTSVANPFGGDSDEDSDEIDAIDFGALFKT